MATSPMVFAAIVFFRCFGIFFLQLIPFLFPVVDNFAVEAKRIIAGNKDTTIFTLFIILISVFLFWRCRKKVVQTLESEHKQAQEQEVFHE